MTRRWSAADARRDASDQTEAMNADRRDEANAARDWDWADDGPTRAEIERDNWDDYR